MITFPLDALCRFRFPTAICCGRGARQELAVWAEQNNVRRPLLVSDCGLLNSSAYELLRQSCRAIWGNDWTTFSEIHPDPPEADAQAGAHAYRDHQADGIIGLGGGSVLDGAKAILLKLVDPDGAIDAIDLHALPATIAPLCAIPTTAGTGSEVGQSTVVTITSPEGQKKKVVLGASALLPGLAILDPELTVDLPAGLTAATGMDAMTHAIESYVCPVYHPLCDGIALESIRRIAEFLPRAVNQPGDLAARGEMLVAAAMGAIAFQKDLGAAHSLAHPLSTEYGVHHGLANAIVLPHVIRFNGEADDAPYRTIADALGLGQATPAAASVADHLECFCRELGLAVRLRDVGVAADAPERLAPLAFADSCHQSNPRRCRAEDLHNLYQKAW